jgi:hypothetical protein
VGGTGSRKQERKTNGRKHLIVGEVRRGKCGKRDCSRKAARRKPVFMPSCGAKCHTGKVLLCEDLMLERGGQPHSSSYKLVALLRNEV